MERVDCDPNLGRGAGGMSVRTGSGECDWRWAVTVTGLVAAAFARPASQLCSPRRRPCPAPCPVPSPTHVLSGLPPHQPLPAVSASCRRASCPAPSRALSQRLETRVRPSPAFFSPEPFPFSPGPRQLTSSLRPTAPTHPIRGNSHLGRPRLPDLAALSSSASTPTPLKPSSQPCRPPSSVHQRRPTRHRPR